ncbi:MAG TPA: hypothetical protein VGN20_06790 [Mucilaginibacter sp.]|jgi:hypothetical protein
MKNLFYTSALAGLILIAASCNKGDLVAPQKHIDTLSSVPVPTPNCSPVESINFVLTNSTGIAGYEIVFSGPQNYNFFFPINGTTTVAVKPGIYSVSVFCQVPGSYSQRTFQLNNMSPVKQAEAHYGDIELTNCTGSQYFSINP